MEGAPVKGSPGSGRGRGRGRGRPGGPNRGRGAPGSGQAERGGNSAFRGGNRGRSPFRGRGGSRGRASTKGVNGNLAHKKQDVHSSESLPTTYYFLHEKISKSQQKEKDRGSSLLITNLPTMHLQDCQSFASFISEKTGFHVEKILFKTHCVASGTLSAVCVIPTNNIRGVINKLHGHIFLDHHLLVERESKPYSQCFAQNCVKVSNLSKTVTEEKLWRLFESCGELGMIYLNHNKFDNSIEALVNMEDPDSVASALKLDGTALDKIKIKVQQLNETLAVYCNQLDHLRSLKELDITHIKKGTHGGIVYFTDKDSYSKAIKLNGQDFKGENLVVTPLRPKLYLVDSKHDLADGSIKSVLNCKMSRHRRKWNVYELLFNSQAEVKKALKVSPVLIKNKLYTLYDNIAKIPSSLTLEDNDSEIKVKKEEVEDDDDSEIEVKKEEVEDDDDSEIEIKKEEVEDDDDSEIEIKKEEVEDDDEDEDEDDDKPQKQVPIKTGSKRQNIDSQTYARAGKQKKRKAH